MTFTEEELDEFLDEAWRLHADQQQTAKVIAGDISHHAAERVSIEVKKAAQENRNDARRFWLGLSNELDRLIKYRKYS